MITGIDGIAVKVFIFILLYDSLAFFTFQIRLLYSDKREKNG